MYMIEETIALTHVHDRGDNTPTHVHDRGDNSLECSNRATQNYRL